LVILGWLWCSAHQVAAQAPVWPDGDAAWQAAKDVITLVWDEGQESLYVPFATHHMRYAYSDAQIQSYREFTWGLGYGRGRYDAQGDWDNVYLVTFLDSHSRQEPTLGFTHEWMHGPRSGWQLGLGYTVFLTARSTERRYELLPGAMGVISVARNGYRLNAGFLPGTKGNGNIAFFWAQLPW